MTLSTITVSHQVNYHTTLKLTLTLCFRWCPGTSTANCHIQTQHTPGQVITCCSLSSSRETVSKTMSHPPPHPGTASKTTTTTRGPTQNPTQCHTIPTGTGGHWSVTKSSYLQETINKQQRPLWLCHTGHGTVTGENLTPDQSLPCSLCLHRASRKQTAGHGCTMAISTAHPSVAPGIEPTHTPQGRCVSHTNLCCLHSPCVNTQHIYTDQLIPQPATHFPLVHDLCPYTLNQWHV